MVGDRIELEALVELLELRRRAQQLIIRDGIVGAAGLGQRATLRSIRSRPARRPETAGPENRPCGRYRPDRSPPRRRPRASRSQSAGADIGSTGRKSTVPAIRGLEVLGREPGDLANAGFAGGELCPIVLLADAQRGDDANAGCHHDRTAFLVAHRRHRGLLYSTASSRAMPSPRTMPDAGDHDLRERAIHRLFDTGVIARWKQLAVVQRQRGERHVHRKLPVRRRDRSATRSRAPAHRHGRSRMPAPRWSRSRRRSRRK